MINYPQPIAWEQDFNRWLQLRAEHGAAGLEEKVAEVRTLLRDCLEEIMALPGDKELSSCEPDNLESIRRLRPEGLRVMSSDLSERDYRARLEGAFLGRCAGCTLGSPVELLPLERIERWAAYLGTPFPPQDYWSQVERPAELSYRISPRAAFTPDHMDGVPADDDTVYTLLGLLILEEYGPEFTVEDVGQAWLDYLPYACTAEEVALGNLRSGLPAREAGAVNNPYSQYIGADIRSDPWGYVAPGLPEKAAELAYKDAFLSHRRNGVYGAMYFAAAIAAAFCVDDPVDALRIGLEEIPAHSLFAESIRWALEVAPEIHDYRDANAAITERYSGMDAIHAINNGALTVWGLTIGKRDFTRIIGETVAMSFDNDCTAATAGSIAGAVLGRDGIPEHWWKSFNNKAHAYLTGHQVFAIDDILDRFTLQARRVREMTPCG
jgi:ADP-ribosylglycohydrolase